MHTVERGGFSGLKLGFKVETCVVSLEFAIEMIHY